MCTDLNLYILIRARLAPVPQEGLDSCNLALEPHTSHERAKAMLAEAAARFQDAAALAMFNWGNVGMSTARKRIESARARERRQGFGGVVFFGGECGFLGSQALPCLAGGSDPPACRFRVQGDSAARRPLPELPKRPPTSGGAPPRGMGSHPPRPPPHPGEAGRRGGR